MEQEAINLPTWAKVVRVLGILMGGAILLMVIYVYVETFRSYGLQYTLRSMFPIGVIMNAYLLLLLPPVGFIKKHRVIEYTFHSLALFVIIRLSIVSYLSTMTEAKTRIFGKAPPYAVPLYYIGIVLVFGIIISYVILVLKWEKFKIEEEPAATAEAT